MLRLLKRAVNVGVSIVSHPLYGKFSYALTTGACYYLSQPLSSALLPIIGTTLAAPAGIVAAVLIGAGTAVSCVFLAEKLLRQDDEMPQLPKDPVAKQLASVILLRNYIEVLKNCIADFANTATQWNTNAQSHRAQLLTNSTTNHSLYGAYLIANKHAQLAFEKSTAVSDYSREADTLCHEASDLAVKIAKLASDPNKTQEMLGQLAVMRDQVRRIEELMEKATKVRNSVEVAKEQCRNALTASSIVVSPASFTDIVDRCRPQEALMCTQPQTNGHHPKPLVFSNAAGHTAATAVVSQVGPRVPAVDSKDAKETKLVRTAG